MLTNHGGVTIVTSFSLQLWGITAQDTNTFKLVCTRISSGQCNYIVVVLYRPGAASVTSLANIGKQLVQTSLTLVFLTTFYSNSQLQLILHLFRLLLH